jgi:hypothetical protein
MIGLYSYQDVLSFDALQRKAEHDRSISLTDAFRSTGRSAETREYRHDALRWRLVALAIVFFGSGVDKLLTSGIGWAALENLSRIMLSADLRFSSDLWFSVNERVVDYPLLVRIGAIGTLILEISFLIAVVISLPITLVVIGLYGMLGSIAFLVGPFSSMCSFSSRCFSAGTLPLREAKPGLGTTETVVTAEDRSSTLAALHPPRPESDRWAGVLYALYEGRSNRT